jgi:hypothetical protein
MLTASAVVFIAKDTHKGSISSIMSFKLLNLYTIQILYPVEITECLGIPGNYFVSTFVSSKDMDMCQSGNGLQALGNQRLVNTQCASSMLLTGGLTNQAVSHSCSFQVAMMNLCTSDPACCKAASSSAVPRGLRIKEACVTPQSDSAGRQVGSFDGDGGGEFAV